MRSVVALRIFLILLLATMLGLFACIFGVNYFTSDSTDGESAGAVFVFALLIIFPMGGFALCGIPLTVALGLLFSSKLKKGGTVTALVALCLLVPVWIFAMFLYGTIATTSPLLQAILAVGSAIFAATFVTCCVAVQKLRKVHKNEIAQ